MRRELIQRQMTRDFIPSGCTRTSTRGSERSISLMSRAMDGFIRHGQWKGRKLEADDSAELARAVATDRGEGAKLQTGRREHAAQYKIAFRGGREWREN